MNTLQELGQKAVTAKYEVQKLSTEKKKRALKAVAKALIAESGEILKANEVDLKNGEEKGMNSGLLDRLRLSDTRITAMADGLVQITQLVTIATLTI